MYIRRWGQHWTFILPLTTSLKTPLQRRTTSQPPACHAPLSHARRLLDNSSKSLKSPLTSSVSLLLRSLHQGPTASNKKNPMYFCNLDKQALVQVLHPPPQPKKQYRVSHKDIVHYTFTEEQVQTLVDLIKEHPCLYDKRHQEYSNHRTKLDLWQQCANLFPNATHLQCRKCFEQNRAAFGKIEAMEMKSSA